MCGIIGYTGKKEVRDILLDGLTALEYRGYDSAGVFISGAGAFKAVGQVKKLREKIPEDVQGVTGIAHTRWATHGVPSENNAHPHTDEEGRVWVVHNGIIENYRELKTELIKAGHSFVSETDSEVIGHLIESHIKAGHTIEDALIKTLKEIRGTYGIAVIDKQQPDTILVARMGSPIVIGLAKDGRFIASDASPLIRHTRDVIYLADGEICVLTPTSHDIFTLDKHKVKKLKEELSFDIAEAKKNGFKHFMLKEIMEGPEVIQNTLRGRVQVNEGLVKLGGLEAVSDKLRGIDRLIIVGCGTAYYAGLVGEYMIEEYAGIPVEVEIASEFRYRKPLFTPNTALLAISQSGETADTLEAVREAKRKGVLTLGIVNTVGSTIARETDAGVYNHAGPEIGVASTKAFISQLTALALLTVFLGRQRSMSVSIGKRIGEELLGLPEKIKSILDKTEDIQKIAKTFKNSRDALYIARKYNMPIAYESALKLKEVSYIHAEGYGAGEMKHGPLAMIDENFPTVAIALKDSVYEKNMSNIQEIKARKGPVFAIATEGDKDIQQLADYVFHVPKTIEMLSPILSAIPLQLFAYFIADAKGYDVDHPRNLAKSVTVE
jgi:glutamine---fructose-6-phosphate transaminase (isomerizing)